MERGVGSYGSVSFYPAEDKEVIEENGLTKDKERKGNREERETTFSVSGGAHLTEEEIKEILRLAEILTKDFVRKHRVYHLFDGLMSVSRYAVGLAVSRMKSKETLWVYVRTKINGELISFTRKWTHFNKNKRVFNWTPSYLEEVFQEDENRRWEEVVRSRTPTPEESYIAKEDMERVRRAIEKLPPVHRRVIEGFFFEGKSLKEMTEDLGLSHGRLSQLKSEGIKKIREILEEEEKIAQKL